MLHVFNVNEARMEAIDVAAVATTGNVRQLQLALQTTVGLPPDDQVLLVSGGEILDVGRQVSSYGGAGTDEKNPFYLVNRKKTDANLLDFAHETHELQQNVTDLHENVRQCDHHSASFEMVQRQAALGAECVACAERQMDVCTRLVNEQHLLHQGWWALVSNLEDTVSTFDRRAERFKTQYDKLMSIKDRAWDLLKSFDQDITLLAQIPLPPCIVQSDSIVIVSPNATEDTSTAPSQMSLLDWISSKDPEHSLKDVASETERLLKHLDGAVWPEIVGHLDTVKQHLQNQEMKEIRGISKRFAQLDHHLRGVQDRCSDQRQFGSSVAEAERRALQSTRDRDSVSGLCQVQRETLLTMLERLEETLSIAKKFAQSKGEVLKNVRVRVNDWILETHRELHNASSKLAIFSEKQSQLKKRMELLRQIHEAPTTYATAVTEVVRRKAFSEEFIAWATELAEKSRRLHDEENGIRREMSAKLGRHFLRSLFHGLDEQKPEFATDPPPAFDQQLPPLHTDNLRAIRESAPSLAALLKVSAPRVYERLLTTDTRVSTMSNAAMHRVDSFFSTDNNPLRLVTAAGGGSAVSLARSFPSTQWLSGDENLSDFSPGSGGMMMLARSPPFGHTTTSGVGGRLVVGSMIIGSPFKGLDLSPLGDTGREEDEQDTPVQDEDQRTSSSTSDAAQQQSSSNRAMSGSCSAKSVPIRIPSRAPSDGISVSTSRQMSEKSSRFGTPEEDILDDAAQMSSPPELISHSQLHDEIGALAKVTGDDDEGSVRRRESRETLSGTEDVSGTLLLERSSSTQQLIKEKNSCIETLAEDLEKERRRNTEIRESFLIETKALKEALKMVKNDCDIASNFTRGSLAENRAALSDALISIVEMSQKCTNDFKEQKSSHSEAQQLQQELEETKRLLEIEREKVANCDEENSTYHDVIMMRDETIAEMSEQLKLIEKSWRDKVEAARSETIKEMTIDAELQLDQFREQFRNELQLKEAEASELRELLTEKDLAIAHLRREQELFVAGHLDAAAAGGSSDAGSSEQLETLRSNYDSELKLMRTRMEKEYKDKLQFLTKGMEERQGEVLKRCRKEAEIELRLAKEEHAAEVARLKENNANSLMEMSQRHEDARLVENLERMAMTTTAVEDTAKEEQQTVGFSDDVLASMSQSTVQLVSPPSASNNDMATSSVSEGPNNGSLGGAIGDTVTTGGWSTVAATAVQTRLRMKDFERGAVITVNDIQEGCTVLVIYDEQHETYVVFSTSSALYFVMERSLRQLGLTTGPSASSSNRGGRSSWLICRVTKSEYCQIRKENNRYHLPMQTRFYRVEVDRLPVSPTVRSPASGTVTK